MSALTQLMERRRDGRARAVALCALLAAVGGVPGREAGAQAQAHAQAQAQAPTFSRDVAPILYANCTTCHRPGGLGPMSLLEFAGAKRVATRIRKAVSTGYMPPWHADAPHGTFVNDRRLSERDKQTIVRWIDAGAPEGDPKQLPPAPVYSTGWTIPSPDAVVAMPEEYEVPAHGTIEYQYFEVPTGFTEDKWVQALEILPGAREVVHHVLVFARQPEPPAGAAARPAANADPNAPRPRPVLVHRHDRGLPQELDSNGSPSEGRELGALIGTTAPGTNVLTFPEGTAMRVRAGSILTFQMHYTAKGHAMKDRTKVGFTFAKSPPAEEIRATQFVNGTFAIPAGAADYPVPAEVGFNESVKIWGIFPHTHLRGKKWEYRLVHSDGRAEVVLSVPNYDFNWQTYYMFAKPLAVPAGARLEAFAWYDNSTGNKSNPDPTKVVTWGDQTWEEMQYTGILMSIDSRRVSASPPK